jgi:hypothetical protein
MTKTAIDWIKESPASQRAQLEKLRSLILDVAPHAEETIKWGQPCYTQNKLFCYLQRAKTHVTLGFQNGALIKDPLRMLKGEGKLMRHINFKAGDMIDVDACRALVQDALRIDSSH